MASEPQEKPAEATAAATATNPAPATTVTTTTDGDVPDGPAIRQQVEYYFSDANLPTDLHLLQCCGGRSNDPVSISRICGFKKMRRWKKHQVVQALRLSTFLDVVDDGKKVKRKVALQGKCRLDADFYDEDAEIEYDPRTRKADWAKSMGLGGKGDGVVHPVPLLPQSKAKYPPGMSKNLMKPTGFEDAYVEAPLKPEEAEEEEAMYDPDKPFVERIELAIQRFKQKRRMHEHYAIVFNKLMRFGGVECGPRMFGAISQQEMKTMDKEEIARALATHNVPWDRQDPKQWEVDFVGVAEAFMSSWYPAHYGYSPQTVTTLTKVLRSFYNYLLFHRVCPEYTEPLQHARSLCSLAETELPKTYSAGLALPGAFNQAASTLAGGYFAGTYVSNQEWVQALQASGTHMEDFGVRDEEARIKFRMGIAVLGSESQLRLMEGVEKGIKVLKREDTGLEVTGIEFADPVTKQVYATQSYEWRHKLRPLEPLGKLRCKPHVFADFKTWDLPRDQYPDGKPSPPAAAATGTSSSYEFWVEDSVLKECFVGMKMVARVLLLEQGVTVLDEVRECMCSFYRYLPNELWMDRKPKEVRWKVLVDDEEGEEEREKEGKREKEGDGDGDGDGGGKAKFADDEFSDDDDGD